MEEIEKQAQKTGIPDDAIVGAVIVAFAVSVFLQTPGSYADVMLFPKIVAGVSLVCGVLILAFAIIRPERSGVGYRSEAVCVAIGAFMFLVMLAAEGLGFFACLFVVCFAINLLISLFCRERGIRSALRSLAVSVVMCGFTFLVFRILLGILTPTGLLF